MWLVATCSVSLQRIEHVIFVMFVFNDLTTTGAAFWLTFEYHFFSRIFKNQTINIKYKSHSYTIMNRSLYNVKITLQVWIYIKKTKTFNCHYTRVHIFRK